MRRGTVDTGSEEITMSLLSAIEDHVWLVPMQYNRLDGRAR